MSIASSNALCNFERGTLNKTASTSVFSADVICPCNAAGSGSVQYRAAPVKPAELAAAVLAHQASLDMEPRRGPTPRQSLAGRDAGSLNQPGAPLEGSSRSCTAVAEKATAQPLPAHPAGAVPQAISSASSAAVMSRQRMQKLSGLPVYRQCSV